MLRLTTVLLAFVLIAACAATPPAEQYLDMRTGATIYRVNNPLLLYRRITAFGKSDAEFIQLAPFEVNRAGDYKLYLWVELPVEIEGDSLTIHIDDAPLLLSLETREGREIGLGEHVYARHAGWGKSGYFALSDEQLQRFVSAETIDCTIGDGEETASFALAGPQPRVRQSFLEMRALTH